MDVIETLANAMLEHGIPVYMRSDNGPETTVKIVRDWLSKVSAKTLSPWENDYCESFNGKLRDELLNGALYSFKEADAPPLVARIPSTLT